jgi:hypothetical protein
LHGADARGRLAIAWSRRSREARTGLIVSTVHKCERPGAPAIAAARSRKKNSQMTFTASLQDACGVDEVSTGCACAPPVAIFILSLRDEGPRSKRRSPSTTLRAGFRLRCASLLMNGHVEGCTLPPFRQKQGERTGHGAFLAGPALIHSSRNSRTRVKMLRRTHFSYLN